MTRPLYPGDHSEPQLSQLLLSSASVAPRGGWGGSVPANAVGKTRENRAAAPSGRRRAARSGESAAAPSGRSRAARSQGSAAVPSGRRRAARIGGSAAAPSGRSRAARSAGGARRRTSLPPLHREERGERRRAFRPPPRREKRLCGDCQVHHGPGRKGRKGRFFPKSGSTCLEVDPLCLYPFTPRDQEVSNLVSRFLLLVSCFSILAFRSQTCIPFSRNWESELLGTFRIGSGNVKKSKIDFRILHQLCNLRIIF